ncbi:MAG: Na+/H+ antiporter NhaA [Acidimicrobiales bacterium]
MPTPVPHGRRRAISRDDAPAATLLLGVVAALVWSALAEGSYQRVVSTRWHLPVLDPLGLTSAHAIVTSGLMTVFFFGVGLELTRERHTGALAHWRHALPPVAGAIGGMTATALLSLVGGLVLDSPALRRGWGVPMATDVAFTLAILALAGRRVPPTLRLFLLTLAVADDVLSVVVLAITGASHPRGVALGVALGVTLLAAMLSRRRRGGAWRVLVLLALWCALALARVEPPLAGVLAAVIVPWEPRHAPRLEDGANRWSTAVVLPLFALVSCGIAWSRLHETSAVLTIVLATIAIRLVGKTLGITSGVALARLGHARLDPALTWPIVATASTLCAIGFTVPLLFASALFPTASATYGAFTVGLLAASLCAALVGTVLLRLLTRSG